MRVLLTGGGTAGSVSPLLAIIQELEKQKPGNQYLFVGTRRGEPEKQMIGSLPYQGVFCGKLRRYFNWRNFIDPFLIILGFFQSIFIILKFKPDIILSAGSFVSVPMVWAGWLLGAPSLIHQQDVQPGLANKLMSPFADKITVTFEKSLADFSQKAVWTGNPIRQELLSGRSAEGLKLFNLENSLPTILMIGGGTGALELNKIIVQSISELTKFCQIIHSTGGGKLLVEKDKFVRYHPCEFLKDEMKEAYAAADLVVSRAGLSSLTELSILSKPAIIIPIPDSHQEENARIFKEAEAAVVLAQKNLTPEKLIGQIKELLKNNDKCDKLRNNIKKIIKPNAAREIVEQILSVTGYISNEMRDLIW